MMIGGFHGLGNYTTLVLLCARTKEVLLCTDSPVIIAIGGHNGKCEGLFFGGMQWATIIHTVYSGPRERKSRRLSPYAAYH